MTDLPSLTGEGLLRAEPASAPRRLRLLALLHLIAAGVGGVCLLVADRAVHRLPLAPLALTLALLMIAHAILLAYLNSRPPARTLEAIIHAQLIVDLLALVVVFHWTGGALNPFFPLFAFPVVVAAAFLGRRVALGYAAFASALYAALLVVERLGWLIPPASPARQIGDLARIAQGLSLAVTCFAAAGATGILVAALGRRARELALGNIEAQEQAAELSRLNEQLQAADEEHRHQRSHLDAAYIELQHAHDRLQVRSSRMSELNEQLRAANAECKLRREELEALSSKLKDAYRRLETRAEHMQDLNEQLRAANAESEARQEELEKLNAELAVANARLRELEDVRAQFTLLVTHELRAPVAAIQSYLRLILDGYVPHEKARETLEKAEKRAAEQLALISDLLELGRIGSADARGHEQPVQIEQLLREQVDMLAGAARERGITLHCDVAPGLPPVLANPDHIRSLWNNLISNAIKYNREDGRVEIVLTHGDGRVSVSVSDTGIGIPPEAMPRLFSEFFRADNAKSLSRHGTGLGLSIVKEIVERAGGRIAVTSEVDKGATFDIWLPAPGGEPLRAPAAEAATS